MSDTRYALYCRNCHHVEDKAWQAATNDMHSFRTEKPLTPAGHVPIYCQKCGQRNWEKPATKEHVDQFDAKQRAEVRAAELTSREDFEGIFKVPDEFNKSSNEVKRALANLLGPLDGDVLRNAQSNLVKLARSGMQGDAAAWIDYCDKAVARAVQSGKQPAKA